MTFCIPHTELKRVLFTLLLPARDGFSDFSERVQYTFTVYAKQTKILQISNVCSDIKSMHSTDYVHTPLIKQSELHSDVHLEVVSRRRFAFHTLYDLYIVTFEAFKLFEGLIFISNQCCTEHQADLRWHLLVYNSRRYILVGGFRIRISTVCRRPARGYQISY